MRQLFLLLPMLVMAACTGNAGNTISQEKFFAGMFIYYADVASFTDCSTNVRYPVSMQRSYIDAEREYMNKSREAMQPAYVEFIGDVILETDEEAGERPTVVIERLITLNPAKTCDWNYMLSGIYDSRTDGERRVLRLKPDYTYTQTIFQDSDYSTTTVGTWYRSASMVLVMVPENGEAPTSFEIVPSQQSMVKNSGGAPLVYKKVYV